MRRAHPGWTRPYPLWVAHDEGGREASREPGFIDLQVNGLLGHDLTADPGALWVVGEALVRAGVTAFLPTLVSTAPSVIERARAVWAAGPPPGYRGARPLGWHVEGPFLVPVRRGAHAPGMLRLPDRGLIADWSPATGVRVVTLAPELPGALELVDDLVGRGVVVAAGHSNATLAEARAGFDAGIRMVTHLWNAMSPLTAREPGLVGAAIDDPRVTLSMIVDGRHIDPAVVAMTWRAAGADRVLLATDAMAGTGRRDGHFPLGSMDVTIDDGAARLPDGTLAGSTLWLDQAVRNLVAFTRATPAEAIVTVTTTPARLLGLAPEASDGVELSDALEVERTIVGGDVVFERAGAR